MKLTDLQPRLYRYESKIEDVDMVHPDYRNRPAEEWRAAGAPTVVETKPRMYLPEVTTLAEAQGVAFLCPKCFRENGGEVGTHEVHVPFADCGVAPDVDAGLPRWNKTGSSLEDLSTTPSILVTVGCMWHGFITNGDVSII